MPELRERIIQRCFNTFRNEYEDWPGYCERPMTREDMMVALIQIGLLSLLEMMHDSFRDWHVGGKSKRAFERVIRVLKRRAYWPPCILQIGLPVLLAVASRLRFAGVISLRGKELAGGSRTSATFSLCDSELTRRISLGTFAFGDYGPRGR
jgi:hypothetical protein